MVHFRPDVRYLSYNYQMRDLLPVEIDFNVWENTKSYWYLVKIT